MKKFDKHKFVNIKAVNIDGNKLYKVTIRNTYKLQIFGNVYDKIKEEELPFLFKTIDIAKDFASILPSKIEKYKAKYSMCKGCPIGCGSKTYETYELTIGDYKAYVKWDKNDIQYRSLGSRRKYVSEHGIVDVFMDDITVCSDGKPCGSTQFEKLSELVQYIDSKKNENRYNEIYDYELVENQQYDELIRNKEKQNNKSNVNNNSLHDEWGSEEEDEDYFEDISFREDIDIDYDKEVQHFVDEFLSKYSDDIVNYFPIEFINRFSDMETFVNHMNEEYKLYSCDKKYYKSVDIHGFSYIFDLLDEGLKDKYGHEFEYIKMYDNNKWNHYIKMY